MQKKTRSVSVIRDREDDRVPSKAAAGAIRELQDKIDYLESKVEVLTEENRRYALMLTEEQERMNLLSIKSIDDLTEKLSKSYQKMQLIKHKAGPCHKQSGRCDILKDMEKQLDLSNRTNIKLTIEMEKKQREFWDKTYSYERNIKQLQQSLNDMKQKVKDKNKELQLLRLYVKRTDSAHDLLKQNTKDQDNYSKESSKAMPKKRSMSIKKKRSDKKDIINGLSYLNHKFERFKVGLESKPN